MTTPKNDARAALADFSKSKTHVRHGRKADALDPALQEVLVESYREGIPIAHICEWLAKEGILEIADTTLRSWLIRKVSSDVS